MQELFNQPAALPALIGAWVVAATQIVLAAIRGAYRLYAARRGAAFSGGLELEVCWQVREDDGTTLLHVFA